MKTIAKAFEEEMSTTSESTAVEEDEVYEYDGTNEQYLLPTEEETKEVEGVKASSTGTGEADNTTETSSFLDKIGDFFGSAVDTVQDSFTFVKESFTFEEPVQGTPDILGNLYRKNVEWGLGQPLPIRPLTQEEYDGYLDMFSKMEKEQRFKDSVAVVSTLVEEGVPLTDIKNLIKGIREMKELEGSVALSKAGQEQDAYSVLEDDPEAVINQSESNVNAVNAVANLRFYDTFLEQKRKGFYKNPVKNFFKGGADLIIPFSQSYRATGLARGSLKEVFEKAGVSSVLESWYANPNEFYSDVRRAFYMMSHRSPEEFQQFVADIDAIFESDLYSNYYALDFFSQVFNTDTIANTMGSIVDVGFITPPAKLATKTGKALLTTKGAVKAARKQLKALKAEGKTVESVEKAIAEAEAEAAKATTKKEYRASQVKLKTLREEERILRGEYVKAAEAVDRTATAMATASGLDLASEFIPGLAMASRAGFIGVMLPIKAAKALGNYYGASRQLSKALVDGLAETAVSSDIHKKHLEAAAEAVGLGGQPFVFKDGVSLTGSTGVKNTIDFLSQAGDEVFKLKDAEAVKRLYEEITSKGLLSKVIRESLEPAAARVAVKLDKALKKARLPQSVSVGIERRSNGVAYVSRVSGKDGHGLNKQQTVELLNAYRKQSKLYGVAEKVKVTETADGNHIDFEYMLKKTEDDSAYSAESFKSIDDLVYENVRRGIQGVEKDKPGAGGVLGPLLNYVKGLSQTVTSFQRVINDVLQHDQGIVYNAMSSLTTKIEKGNEKVLDYLINRTRADSKWYSSEGLRALGISKRNIAAYEAYKALSDLSWLLYRRNLVDQLTKNGMKSVSISVNGTLYDVGISKRKDYKDIKGFDILRVEGYDDVAEDLVGELNPEDLSLTAQDYNFYRTLYSSHGTNYVAIRKDSLIEQEIDAVSLDVSYIPGRMLFSPDSAFIKQTVTNERGQLNAINTLFAHPDFINTKKAAVAMEEMRQLVIKVDDGSMTEEAAMKAFKEIKNGDLVRRYGDWTSFKNACKGEDAIFSLNPRDRIQVVRDGEKIEGLSMSDEQEFFNFKGASFLGYSNFEKIVEKRMRKGANIYNPFTLSTAPRMTATEEIATTVHNIMNTTTKAEYTALMAEDMVRLFKGKGINTLAEAKDALLYGAPQGLNSDVKDAVDHMSRMYKTIFGLPTEFDIAVERGMQRIASAICPDYAGKGGLRTSTYYAIRNMSPLKKTQALAFHWYLGMLNFRQFYKQASSLTQAVQMSPVAGGKALGLGIPFMIYMMSRDGGLGQRIAKMASMNLKDLDLLAKTVNRLDVTSRGSYSGALELDAKSTARWKLNSTFFYDAGDRVNKYFTALVTALEAQAKGVDLSKLSEADIANMLVRQNTLYLNMGRAGMSPIQTGMLRTLTQFRGFTFRWLDTIFGERTISAGTKWAMGVTTLLTSGVVGAVGRGAASTVYNWMSDKAIDDDAKQIVTQGVLDWMMQELGYDVSVGEFFEISAGDLFDSFISAPPSLKAMPSAFNTMLMPYVGLYHMVNPQNEVGETFFSYKDWLYTEASMLAKGGDLPSGIGKYLTLYGIYNGEGGLYNRQGYKTREDMSTARKIAYGLGFRSIREAENFLLTKRIQGVKEDISAIADEFMLAMSKAVEEPQNEKAFFNRAYYILDVAKNILPEDSYSELDVEVKSRLRNLGKSQKESILKGMLKYLSAEEVRKTYLEMEE